MDVSKYYDSEPAGADYATTTPWLNRPFTLTEYGARGVPNVYITRAYMSGGIGDWNASHYKNPKFDALAKTYLAAAEVAAQRKATKGMAGILLRDTPVVTDYFIKLRHGELLEGQGLRPRGPVTHPPGEGQPGLRTTRTSGWRAVSVPPPALRSQAHRSVARFLLKRIGLALITLILLSMIVFAVSTILPGNVGRAVLGPFAAQESVDAAQRAARNEPADRRAVPGLGRAGSSTATSGRR